MPTVTLDLDDQAYAQLELRAKDYGLTIARFLELKALHETHTLTIMDQGTLSSLRQYLPAIQGILQEAFQDNHHLRAYPPEALDSLIALLKECATLLKRLAPSRSSSVGRNYVPVLTFLREFIGMYVLDRWSDPRYNPGNHHVRLELDESVPVLVRLDHDTLSQVLMVLIHSAMQDSPAGSEVVVRGARYDSTQLLFSVQHTGTPLPPEERERYGEWPLDTQDLRKGQSVRSCQHYVERHGGTIWATNEGEKGLPTVWFTLPITIAADDREYQALRARLAQMYEALSTLMALPPQPWHPLYFSDALQELRRLAREERGNLLAFLETLP
ncbi:sensor histidine kinase [Armatimonas rosea]|uniref:Signal transduction histidine kinase n=1 Tax=Armatimonas rosea TaxID=685828 RepID=A0A7W9W4I3_ARMRO|nr:ATP-binding protein [Armatimonas rosea]MBB6049459.1 signal transduction histidine kinase [Armatimonas rosea]